jgi:hypothetical protein
MASVVRVGELRARSGIDHERHIGRRTIAQRLHTRLIPFDDGEFLEALRPGTAADADVLSSRLGPSLAQAAKRVQEVLDAAFGQLFE